MRLQATSAGVVKGTRGGRIKFDATLTLVDSREWLSLVSYLRPGPAAFRPSDVPLRRLQRFQVACISNADAKSPEEQL